MTSEDFCRCCYVKTAAVLNSEIVLIWDAMNCLVNAALVDFHPKYWGNFSTKNGETCWTCSICLQMKNNEK